MVMIPVWSSVSSQGVQLASPWGPATCLGGEKLTELPPHTPFQGAVHPLPGFSPVPRLAMTKSSATQNVLSTERQRHD